MIPEMVNVMRVGQVTVSSTTPTKLPDTTIKPQSGVWVRPLAGNTGILYFGGPDVAAGTGFQMIKTDAPFFIPICDLNALYFLAATNADKFSYFIT